MSIVFLQKRAHKAGAQASLARLLRHPRLQALSPVLLTGQKGWLTAECDSIGIRYLIHPFPSSRSLAGRLFQNFLFVARVGRRLAALGIRPRIVHANDHPEGLLALRLARWCGARSAIFLRSGGMSRRDYEKYRCHAYDLIMAVGEELQQRVQAWDPQREILLVPNALYDSEFFPPKPKALAFPRQWLVIGTPHVQKGWADLIDALYQLEREGILPPLCIDFTGDEPDPAHNDLGLHRLAQTQTRFLGRVEDFPGLVRRYDLVINPSRQESFGMAAIETLAAGVPLLSSRTGVIEQVQPFPYLLFAPADPGDLARALKHLIRHWDRLDIDVKRCQERIRQRFSIDQSVERLCRAYERVLDA